MGRGRPSSGTKKELFLKAISSQDRKELKILADNFGLLHGKEVQKIIANCKNYAKGQQKIMRVYTAVYMQ